MFQQVNKEYRNIIECPFLRINGTQPLILSLPHPIHIIQFNIPNRKESANKLYWTTLIRFNVERMGR